MWKGKNVSLGYAVESAIIDTHPHLPAFLLNQHHYAGLRRLTICLLLDDSRISILNIPRTRRWISESWLGARRRNGSTIGFAPSTSSVWCAAPAMQPISPCVVIMILNLCSYSPLSHTAIWQFQYEIPPKNIWETHQLGLAHEGIT